MATITINGVTLDPTVEGAQLAHRSLLAVDAARSNYILVQTSGPLTADQKVQLKRLDVQLLEYVPSDTYICRYEPSDLDTIRGLPFVTWVNVYMEGFKIEPTLHAAAQGPRAKLLSLNSVPHSPNSPLQLVDVVLHRDVDTQSVSSDIGSAAGRDPLQLKQSRGKIRVHVDPDRLSAIAAIDQVRSIEPVSEKKLWNNLARGILGADSVQAHGQLMGEGQIVAVCDTGFDTGSETQPHPAFANRVVKLYALGRRSASDPNGHGTHVCGSVLGDGISGTLGVIRGSAPKAKLVMQSVLDARGGLGGIPDDLHQLFEPPYADGARVHSNSWGDSRNAYTQEAHDVDAFVWEHRDAVIVIAAGNDGTDRNRNGVIDAGSVGSPATAKNCITVGASENDRPNFVLVDGRFRIMTYGEGWGRDFPVNPIRDDKLADNPNGLAAFSSRGPTSDGRLKPDVVAPGTGILSARSRAVGVGNGWGPSTDPLYHFEGGTSMATPLVSGCAAVVREYLQSKQVPNPTAALVKAMLINGAEPLSGQYTPTEAGAIPNNDQGFGRVNLAATVGTIPTTQVLKFWDEDVQLDTAEEKVFTLDLVPPLSTVKVTLVWTDPPGEVLQNDLDLTVVTATGVTALGNAAAGSRVPDRVNNVEQVTIAAPAGKLTILVKAFRIAIHPQSFALVVRAAI